MRSVRILGAGLLSAALTVPLPAAAQRSDHNSRRDSSDCYHLEQAAAAILSTFRVTDNWCKPEGADNRQTNSTAQALSRPRQGSSQIAQGGRSRRP